MIDWKGNQITAEDFAETTEDYGAPFWDFHRADLHSALLDNALELGATLQLTARVSNVNCSDLEIATVILSNGERKSAQLVVGADNMHTNWPKEKQICLPG